MITKVPYIITKYYLPELIANFHCVVVQAVLQLEIGITKIKHYGVLCCTCVSVTGLLIWFGYNTFSSKILGSVFTFRGTFAYFHYI